MNRNVSLSNDAARRESIGSWLGSQQLNSWPSGRNVTKGYGRGKKQDFAMKRLMQRLIQRLPCLLDYRKSSYVPGGDKVERNSSP